MSFIKGSLTVECNNCGKQHTLSEKDADFQDTYSDERSMGTENGYTWEQSFECDGNSCGNRIDIEYEVWEYPEGAFNNDTVNVKGAKVISKYGYDFSQDY